MTKVSECSTSSLRRQVEKRCLLTEVWVVLQFVIREDDALQRETDRKKECKIKRHIDVKQTEREREREKKGERWKPASPGDIREKERERERDCKRERGRERERRGL